MDTCKRQCIAGMCCCLTRMDVHRFLQPTLGIACMQLTDVSPPEPTLNERASSDVLQACMSLSAQRACAGNSAQQVRVVGGSCSESFGTVDGSRHAQQGEAQFCCIPTNLGFCNRFRNEDSYTSICSEGVHEGCIRVEFCRKTQLRQLCMRSVPCKCPCSEWRHHNCMHSLLKHASVAGVPTLINIHHCIVVTFCWMNVSVFRRAS